MSSELKLTNLKHASSSSNNIVLASDGTTTASGLVSLSNGINGVRYNQAVNTNQVDLSAGYQTAVSTTITPKSSSSKLLVLGVLSVFTEASGSRVHARIRLTATGHTTSYSDTQEYIGYQASSDSQIMLNVPINYIFTVSNTNEYTIALRALKDNGTAYANYDDSSGDQKSTLQVIEI